MVEGQERHAELSVVQMQNLRGQWKPAWEALQPVAEEAVI